MEPMIAKVNAPLNKAWFDFTIGPVGGAPAPEELGHTMAYACVRALHFLKPLEDEQEKRSLFESTLYALSNRFDRLPTAKQEALRRAAGEALSDRLGRGLSSLREECFDTATIFVNILQAESQLGVKLDPALQSRLVTWFEGVCVGVMTTMEAKALPRGALCEPKDEEHWPAAPRRWSGV
jgi:hypothetical protein